MRNLSMAKLNKNIPTCGYNHVFDFPCTDTRVSEQVSIWNLGHTRKNKGRFRHLE